MRSFASLFLLLSLLLQLPACEPEAPGLLPTLDTPPDILSVTPSQNAQQFPSETPAVSTPVSGFSPDQIATLTSLRLVDDFPLYEMHYQGEYSRSLTSAADTRQPAPGEYDQLTTQSAWSCSLFAALGDPEDLLFGRNFDWNYSPTLLLYTDPPDGYASVSLVDIAYLFDSSLVDDLSNKPLQARRPLLRAPFMPFDGMNEHGLAIGMAAVLPGQVPLDPAKPSIDSLTIMRQVLDHARDVDEALEVFQSFNVLMDGGPPLHYLVADRSGRAVLVEYTDQVTAITNQDPWHLATNHLRALVEPGSPSGCWRYDMIEEQLASSGGRLTAQKAIDLLEEVSQTEGSATQWSVVYGMSNGEVQVSMGRDYGEVLSFQLEMAEDIPALHPGDLP